jgi:hypothetical protein
MARTCIKWYHITCGYVVLCCLALQLGGVVGPSGAGEDIVIAMLDSG